MPRLRTIAIAAAVIVVTDVTWDGTSLHIHSAGPAEAARLSYPLGRPVGHDADGAAVGSPARSSQAAPPPTPSAAGIPRTHGRGGAVLRASTPWQRHGPARAAACDRGQSARQTDSGRRATPRRTPTGRALPPAPRASRWCPSSDRRRRRLRGRVIWAANRNRRLPIASTTKIMTAHLVLERLSLNRVITIDNGVTRVPLVKEGLRPGEESQMVFRRREPALLRKR